MKIIKDQIREVPNFPKPGITFYDITTVFEHPEAMNNTLNAMQEFVASTGAEKIVGIESRGFVLAAALADRLKLGLVLARKPGKLPSDSIAEEYDLEYGTDKLEMHSNAIGKNEKVVVVDDLIATGGSLLAACTLVERLGGKVVGISSVIALKFLPFAEKLSAFDVNYLIGYDSE